MYRNQIPRTGEALGFIFKRLKGNNIENDVCLNSRNIEHIFVFTGFRNIVDFDRIRARGSSK